MIIPISIDTRLCHFCSYNAVENEAHFMLECPLYNPIRDKFPSLFENVVPRSLKSFFPLDQQVKISLYLTKATTLRHSKELSSLKPSWCIFNLISLFSFLDFKANFISFQFISLSFNMLFIFEEVGQSLFNMCFYDACSLILIEPHTKQISGSNHRNEPLKTHLP